MGTRIDGDRIVLESGRRLTLGELGSLADKLVWKTPYVIIMPPHEYVVEGKLTTEEERATFEALRYACAKHPSAWKAFFRAYKSKNSYLVIGDYRYWYSQLGSARMMNRCDRRSELENTRGGEGERAIKAWTGSPYAWKREYGIECENLDRYCNVVVVKGDSAGGFAIARYAAMVSREDMDAWEAARHSATSTMGAEEEIRRLLDGVEAIPGVKPSNSRRADCSEAEASLRGAWMWQRDMSPSRVATDLRWFSMAQWMEVERALPLNADAYMVSLRVPAVA